MVPLCSPTFVGPLVGSLVGPLVGLLVGPLVGILVDPLVRPLFTLVSRLPNVEIRSLCEVDRFGVQKFANSELQNVGKISEMLKIRKSEISEIVVSGSQTFGIS